MISNALVRLSSRICNFIATAKTSNSLPIGNVTDDLQGHGWRRPDISRNSLLSRWHSVAHELDVWFDGLPPTFKPSARIRPFKQPYIQGSEDRARMIHEIWFAIPMCASTMQHYHMARILMLLHKPQISDVRQQAKDNLQSTASDTEDLVYHCYEIW